MDFNEIKKWLTDPAERFVFIEEGKPAFVVMGLDAYRKLKGQNVKDMASGAPKMGGQEDMINAELEAERLKAKELAAKMAMDGGRASEPEAPSFTDPSRIRLEDLPL